MAIQKRFRDIALGSTFRFVSELSLGWQGARGPWVKLTPRKYRHEDSDALSSITIGSVSAAVVEVAPC